MPRWAKWSEPELPSLIDTVCDGSLVTLTSNMFNFLWQSVWNYFELQSILKCSLPVSIHTVWYAHMWILTRSNKHSAASDLHFDIRVTKYRNYINRLYAHVYLTHVYRCDVHVSHYKHSLSFHPEDFHICSFQKNHNHILKSVHFFRRGDRRGQWLSECYMRCLWCWILGHGWTFFFFF